MTDQPVLIEGSHIAGTLMDRQPDRHGLLFVNVGGTATRVHPDLITKLPVLHDGRHRLTIVVDGDGAGQSCGSCGDSLAPLTRMPVRRVSRWLRVAA